MPLLGMLQAFIADGRECRLVLAWQAGEAARSCRVFSLVEPAEGGLCYRCQYDLSSLTDLGGSGNP